MERPPERIELAEAGVVLRRHRLADVDALQAVIETSRDHLRPFMPWADQDRDATAGFVESAIAGWQSGDNFNNLVTRGASNGEEEQLLGGCGLHRRRGPESLEIGYWLRPDAIGRGLMTAAAAALTEAAFALDGISRVEIRCDGANDRSAAIPRRLGYRLVGVEDRQAQSEAGPTNNHLIFALDRPRVSAPPPGP